MSETTEETTELREQKKPLSNNILKLVILVFAGVAGFFMVRFMVNMGNDMSLLSDFRRCCPHYF